MIELCNEKNMSTSTSQYCKCSCKVKNPMADCFDIPRSSEIGKKLEIGTNPSEFHQYSKTTHGENK